MVSKNRSQIELLFFFFFRCSVISWQRAFYINMSNNFEVLFPPVATVCIYVWPICLWSIKLNIMRIIEPGWQKCSNDFLFKIIVVVVVLIAAFLHCDSKKVHGLCSLFFNNFFFQNLNWDEQCFVLRRTHLFHNQHMFQVAIVRLIPKLLHFTSIIMAFPFHSNKKNVYSSQDFRIYFVQSFQKKKNVPFQRGIVVINKEIYVL